MFWRIWESRITVSDWLKNNSQSAELSDSSSLSDIKNVKGDETFTQDGEKLTWQADGSDIYYQGTTDKELPVTVKLTYYLDGQEISPEDLAGKSGKVKIRIDYTNNQKETVKINGEDREIYTPFAMISGMILSQENFSNVKVTNGKVISDGSRNIVVGVALPGLSDSIGLSDTEDLKDIDIPEYVEVEADTTNFKLEMTATVATTGVLEDLGIEDLDDLKDLKDRLSKIVCAYTYDGQPVTAGQIGAAGAMTALLKDAIDPNLVQTLENNPAIIHGGPFANIAHGCNSVTATKLSLKLADYVVTEAGFGADLGAEKFLDIKCRMADLHPSAVVLVATVRALKSHGDVAKADLSKPDAEAVARGAANLERHIDNIKNQFGLPVCVAINAFPTDTDEEMAVIREVCGKAGVPCALSEVFARGGEGGKELAETVLSLIPEEPKPIRFTYELDAPLTTKIEAVAKKIYRADGVVYSAAAKKTLDELTAMGYGNLPVCIAKTQYSFSDNAKLTGAPTGFEMNVREVRLSAGAGFMVVICGNIMTMPGLPRHPAAMDIDCDENGRITGLF